MGPDCPICKGEGWRCEEHPERQFLHDDCPGPGIPCVCNPEEKMPPGTKIICERDAKKPH